MFTLEKTRKIEALQNQLEASWIETNLRRLQNEFPKISGPTAYLVSQKLLAEYLQKPYAVEIDRVQVRAHVQKTLVESYLADSSLLTELVKIDYPTIYAWFTEDIQEKLTPESLPQYFTYWLKQRPERLNALMMLHSQQLSRSILQMLAPQTQGAVQNTWEKLLGLILTRSGDSACLPKFVEVINAAHYHDVRDALAQKRFDRSDDSDWPTARLEKGNNKGYAELRPDHPDKFGFLPPEEQKALVESMWRQREELSDIDADALDALSTIWLGQARTPEQPALGSINEILEIRGILPKKNGVGRRGGYETEQRREIIRALGHIQSIWMNMNEVDVFEGTKRKKMAIRSRVFTITDMAGQMRLDGHFEVEQFLFRPGQVFAHFLLGVGRQTALLSAQALRYNPYRQAGEKRLTRYFSWQWRCQAGKDLSKSYRVETLLEAYMTDVRSEQNSRHPNRLRDRFEQILDRLQQDGVIRSWSYCDWEETIVGKRGWWLFWLDSQVKVEAPKTIVTRYSQIPKSEPKLVPKINPKKVPKDISPAESPSPLTKSLKDKREELGLSYAQLARKIGVHRTAIARIEKGERQPSSDILQKIEAWTATAKPPATLFD